MKIFVINLKESVNRRKLMESQLKKLNCDYEFIEAVNGRALTDSQMDEYCNMEVVRANPNWLTRGIIGATLSHQISMKKLLNSGDETAVLMEDDCLLPANFNEVTAEIEKIIVEDELVLLHWSSAHKQYFKLSECQDLADNLKVGIPSEQVTVGGAVCFMLKRGTAKKMLDFNTPLHIGPDDWNQYLEKGILKQIRCVIPQIIELAHLPSDLGYRSSFMVKILRTLEFSIPLFHKMMVKRRQKRYSERLNYEVIKD